MPMAQYRDNWMPPSDVVRVDCPICGTDYILRIPQDTWRDFACTKPSCGWKGQVHVWHDHDGEGPTTEFKFRDEGGNDVPAYED